jgi:hypothetical protein
MFYGPAGRRAHAAPFDASGRPTAEASNKKFGRPSRNTPHPLTKPTPSVASPPPGRQAFCLGTAAIYTAPAMEGPWTFSGNLFNQMALDGKVRGFERGRACR